MDYQKALSAILTGATSATVGVRLPDVATTRQVFQALSEVRLSELPTWPLAEATLTLRQRLAEIEPLVGNIYSGKASGRDEASPFADQLIAADKAIAVFDNERESLLRR
jgi:hypothetical protein